MANFDCTKDEYVLLLNKRDVDNLQYALVHLKGFYVSLSSDEGCNVKERKFYEDMAKELNDLHDKIRHAEKHQIK